MRASVREGDAARMDGWNRMDGQAKNGGVRHTGRERERESEAQTRRHKETQRHPERGHTGAPAQESEKEGGGQCCAAREWARAGEIGELNLNSLGEDRARRRGPHRRVGLPRPGLQTAAIRHTVGYVSNTFHFVFLSSGGPGDVGRARGSTGARPGRISRRQGQGAPWLVRGP